MRINPLSELHQMHTDMNRLVNTLWGGGQAKQSGLPTTQFRMPTADVVETENNVLATVEIPGASKEDIELNVTAEEIEVKVEQKKQQEDKESYNEVSHQFYRRLPLPAEVDGTQAEAVYKDGVLRIEIPKQKQLKQRVDIK